MSQVNKINLPPISLPSSSSHVPLLIADKDEQTVSSLQLQLQAGGYSVLAATTYQQVLQLMRQQPHLMILGEHLDDITGGQVCQQIKSNNNWGYVPVILITDTQEPREEQLATIFSPDVTLSKPIDQADFKRWLYLLLRIRQQFNRPAQKNAIKTQEIDLLRSDIIANVSHELGTPMVQVKAAVSFLKEDITKTGTPDQIRLADMATQAATRLEIAIENVRQLAKTHNIKQTPIILGVSVELAIRHINRNWVSLGQSERIQKLFADDLPLIYGDTLALGRLLQLLLDNALKFSPADSTVYIKAKRINEDQVWVGVQDFGIGIAREEQAHIFEALYQIDASTTRRYSGIGAGLALACLLANGMQTTIEVESTLGKGSTFSFILPIARLDDPAFKTNQKTEYKSPS